MIWGQTFYVPRLKFQSRWMPSMWEAFLAVSQCLPQLLLLDEDDQGAKRLALGLCRDLRNPKVLSHTKCADLIGLSVRCSFS